MDALHVDWLKSDTKVETKLLPKPFQYEGNCQR